MRGDENGVQKGSSAYVSSGRTADPLQEREGRQGGFGSVPPRPDPRLVTAEDDPRREPRCCAPTPNSGVRPRVGWLASRA